MTRPALLSIAIHPKTDSDRERLARGLAMLTAEDPTIRVKTDRAHGEVVISGMDELQLENVIDRLKREFHVEAGVGRPRVAYKETLTRAADGEIKYVERVGGHGQYAHAKIHLYPGEPGSGYVFETDIAGGAIPLTFIKPIDEGIREALARGIVAGYPVDDLRPRSNADASRSKRGDARTTRRRFRTLTSGEDSQTVHQHLRHSRHAASSVRCWLDDDVAALA